jgi:hypothetical protein
MRGLKPVVAIALVAASIAGCDSGEQTLTASEFIDRINAEGISIVLGRQLSSGGNADELYLVELPPVPGQPELPPDSDAEPGAGAGGSLYVFDDTGGAEEQLEACQASAGLLCFRASNIVVVLDEESGPLEARRLAVAMQRLAD